MKQHLPTAEGTDGFVPFGRALSQSETQTAMSGIWTQVADSIFYADNRNTKYAL